MPSAELFIAFRYLKARRKGFFPFLTTFITVGCTTLGVAALIITLAVMSGFQNDIRNKILGVQPHIIVTRIDGEPFIDYLSVESKILANKSVSTVSPFIYKQGIIRGINSAAYSGIIIKALDYENENKALKLSEQITASDINFSGKEIGGKSIMLGNELAKSIAAVPGDEIILMFPVSFGDIPKMHKFTVSAVIQSGMYDFDSSFGFIDFEEGQKLFSMYNEATGLDVNTNDFDKAINTAAQLQKDLSYPYRAKAWIEMNKNLFSALRLEKIMMFLILGLIILIASFNIISNLLLLSVQKSKDTGILSAVGFSKFSISKIFFYEGFIIGSVGALLGIILGLAISSVLKYFDIFRLPEGVYYVDKLPITVISTDVFTVSVSAFIVTIMAGLYPAYHVSKSDPLEAIRYG